MSGQFSSRLPVRRIFNFSFSICLFCICVQFIFANIFLSCVCACSDPPLSEEDIPSGLWLCHTCRMTQQLQKSNAKSRVNSIEQDLAQIEQRSRQCAPDSSDVPLTQPDFQCNNQKNDTASGCCNENLAVRTISIASLPTPPLPITSAPQNARADNGTNGIEATVNGIAAPSLITNDDGDGASDEIKTEDERPSERRSERNDDRTSINLRTSLDQLVYAASIMNPKQFELPRELNIFPKFPGDDKGNVQIDIFLVNFSQN